MVIAMLISYLTGLRIVRPITSLLIPAHHPLAVSLQHLPALRLTEGSISIPFFSFFFVAFPDGI
jgi:hypothetical protein